MSTEDFERYLHPRPMYHRSFLLRRHRPDWIAPAVLVLLGAVALALIAHAGWLPR